MLYGIIISNFLFMINTFLSRWPKRDKKPLKIRQFSTVSAVFFHKITDVIKHQFPFSLKFSTPDDDLGRQVPILDSNSNVIDDERFILFPVSPVAVLDPVDCQDLGPVHLPDGRQILLESVIGHMSCRNDGTDGNDH